MFNPIVVANYGTAAAAGIITGWTFNTSFNTSGQEGQPNKISYGEFNKLYILGDQYNAIKKYEPDGTYTNDNLGIDASSGYSGLSIAGTYPNSLFYVYENTGGDVVSYLGDFSSGTSTSVFIAPQKPGGDTRNFKWFDQLGSFWQLDIANDMIWEVDINGSYTGGEIDISGQSGNARGLTYDGQNFWITDITNDEAYQYSYDSGTQTGTYTGNSVDISSYAGICVDITYFPFTDQFFLLNYDATKTVSIVDPTR